MLSYPKKPLIPRRDAKFAGGTFAFWFTVFSILATIGLYIAVIGIAIHFVTKYW